MRESTDVRWPIVGAFSFMSPQLIRLNQVILDALMANYEESELECNVTGLIIDANLYSLQAVALLNMLPPPAKHTLRAAVGQYGKQVNDEWMRTRDLLSERVLSLLRHIWTAYRNTIRRRRVASDKQMFSLISARYDAQSFQRDSSDDSQEWTCTIS